MRIPKKVKIGAYTYKVKYESKIMHGDNECNGLCDNEAKIISLNKSLTEVEMMITFIHECLHVMEYVYNFKLGEKRVGLLDHALVAFFRDNKVEF